MANHVTNNIKFKGKEEDIIALRNAIRPDKTKENEDELSLVIDFGKIIPMPPSLKIPSGSSTDNGLAIIKFQKTGNPNELSLMLSWPWVKAEGISKVDELVKYLIESKRADLVAGQQALDNIEKYGYKDWYDWSTAIWGTKWNAYSQTENSIDDISFHTAWSSPIPVIRNLSKMFPNVEITLRYADEDFGYNCGEITFAGGVEKKVNIPKGGSIKALILATEINGGNFEDLIGLYGSVEDEEFATDIVAVLFKKLKPGVIVDIAVDHDDYCGATLVLEAIKAELLDRELYELVGKIDEKIKEVENVKEEDF